MISNGLKDNTQYIIECRNEIIIIIIMSVHVNVLDKNINANYKDSTDTKIQQSNKTK
jgi:hypothetical protein